MTDALSIVIPTLLSGALRAARAGSKIAIRESSSTRIPELNPSQSSPDERELRMAAESALR